jgi:hypothetical protein
VEKVLEEESAGKAKKKNMQWCKEDPIYVFPEMKLRTLAPNSYIHVSVSDLYIPRIGLPILQQNFRYSVFAA